MKYPCCRCCCDTQPQPYMRARCNMSVGPRVGHDEPCPNTKVARG